MYRLLGNFVLLVVTLHHVSGSVETNRMFNENAKLRQIATETGQCVNNVAPTLSDVYKFLNTLHSSAVSLKTLKGRVEVLPPLLKSVEGIPIVGAVAKAIRVVLEAFAPIVKTSNTFAQQIDKVIAPWLGWIASLLQQIINMAKPVTDVITQTTVVEAIFRPAVGCSSKVEHDKGRLSQSVVQEMDRMAKLVADASNALSQDFGRLKSNCEKIEAFTRFVKGAAKNLPDISGVAKTLEKLVDIFKPVDGFVTEVGNVMNKKIGCLPSLGGLIGKRDANGNITFTEEEIRLIKKIIEEMEKNEKKKGKGHGVSKREICFTVGDFVKGVSAVLTGGFSAVANTLLGEVAKKVIDPKNIPGLPKDINIFQEIIKLANVKFPQIGDPLKALSILPTALLGQLNLPI